MSCHDMALKLALQIMLLVIRSWLFESSFFFFQLFLRVNMSCHCGNSFSLLYWTPLSSPCLENTWDGCWIWRQCGGTFTYAYHSLLLSYILSVILLIALLWKSLCKCVHNCLPLGYWGGLLSWARRYQEAIPCSPRCWSYQDYNWKPCFWCPQGISLNQSFVFL